MAKKPVLVPYGTTVFCDDIRNELDGKLTLVGVYTTYMVLPQVPFLVAKMGFAVNLVVPRLEQPTPLRMSIYLPGQDDSHHSFQTEGMIQPEPLRPEDAQMLEGTDIPEHAKIAQQVVISPLQIQEEGFFRVRMNLGGSLIKAGVLRVMTSATAATIPGHAMPQSQG